MSSTAKPIIKLTIMIDIKTRNKINRQYVIDGNSSISLSDSAWNIPSYSNSPEKCHYIIHVYTFVKKKIIYQSSWQLFSKGNLTFLEMVFDLSTANGSLYYIIIIYFIIII